MAAVGRHAARSAPLFELEAGDVVARVGRELHRLTAKADAGFRRRCRCAAETAVRRRRRALRRAATRRETSGWPRASVTSTHDSARGAHLQHADRRRAAPPRRRGPRRPASATATASTVRRAGAGGAPKAAGAAIGALPTRPPLGRDRLARQRQRRPTTPTAGSLAAGAAAPARGPVGVLSVPGGTKKTPSAASTTRPVIQNHGPKDRPDPSRWTSAPGRSRNGAFRPLAELLESMAGRRRQQAQHRRRIDLQRAADRLRERAREGRVGQRVEAVGLEHLELLRRHLDRRRERGDVQALLLARLAQQSARPVGAPAARRRLAGSLIEVPAGEGAASRESGKRLRSWVPKSFAPWRLPSLFSIRAASQSVCALATSGRALTRRT